VGGGYDAREGGRGIFKNMRYLQLSQDYVKGRVKAG